MASPDGEFTESVADKYATVIKAKTIQRLRTGGQHRAHASKAGHRLAAGRRVRLQRIPHIADRPVPGIAAATTRQPRAPIEYQRVARGPLAERFV